MPSRDTEEKSYARFDGCSHTCMQGLMVVGFIVDEILRVGLKNDKVTGA